MKPTVTVKQNPEKPVAVEIIAESIVTISQAMRKLRQGQLNDKALLLLVHNAVSPAGTVTRSGVKAVMDAIENLEREYLKKRV